MNVTQANEQSIKARVGRQRTSSTTTSTTSSSSSSPTTTDISISPTIDVFFFVEGALNGCVSLYAHLPSITSTSSPTTSSASTTTAATATATTTDSSLSSLRQQLTSLALVHTPQPLLTGITTLSRPTSVSILFDSLHYPLPQLTHTTHPSPPPPHHTYVPPLTPSYLSVSLSEPLPLPPFLFVFLLFLLLLLLLLLLFFPGEC